VVAALVASGQVVHVGCSTGADALVVLSFRPSWFPHLRAFCAFAPSGAGACSVSAVQVVQSFAWAGGQVSWLAGGPVSLPLRARLIRRSAAALAGCSAAVFFQPGAGSLAVASIAVKAGQPVFAFCAVPPAAVPGQAGAWVPSLFMGFSCWAWQSAQASMF